MQDVRLPFRRDKIARNLEFELPECLGGDQSPWHSVVCSRLGRNLVAKRTAIAVTRKFIEAANLRGEQTLVVRDTASHPWSDRACELLGFNPLRIAGTGAAAPWVPIEIESFCRDKTAIELADRVDATFVRPGGKIMRLLCDRLERAPTGLVQVLVTDANEVVAKELIARGAVGYWLNLEPHLVSAPIENPKGPMVYSRSRACDSAIRSLIEHPEHWLIHSTRERVGPWPGQSEQQFKDWLLLSEPSLEPSSPLETLRRIVHEKRLVGSHRTTSSSSPVVCFTAMPLRQWLSRRKFRPHLGRWDAEPYGVALKRGTAERLGVQSVIYGDKVTLANLDKESHWRFQAVGTTYDWTSEQEWRGRGVLDLSRFAEDEAIVFVKDAHSTSLLQDSPWPVLSVETFELTSNSYR